MMASLCWDHDLYHVLWFQNARKVKEAGNKLHQAADYNAAMKKYLRALDAISGKSHALSFVVPTSSHETV